MKNQKNWDLKYLNLARNIKTWSKDPSRKIGAVIIGSNNQIVSCGYNGFPRGIEDLPERLNNREIKYKYIVHAEANAIYNALENGAQLRNCTIYVSGLPVCHECAKAIIQCGIKRVVSDTLPNDNWTESGNLAIEMFKEADIEVDFITEN